MNGEWSLDVLYESFEDEKYQSDLKKARELVAEFQQTAAGLAGSMYQRYKNGASGLVVATATMVVLRQAFMALKINNWLIIAEGLVILLTILNKDKKELM